MTNARKGIALPTGHGETRGDATKITGPFTADGSVKPRHPVILNADEETLNVAQTGQAKAIGILPFFDGTDVDWGSTTPSESTAYPTTAVIPWIYGGGHVKAAIDASETADSTQMGSALEPRAGGFGTHAVFGGGTGFMVVKAADRLVENVSDGFGEVFF